MLAVTRARRGSRNCVGLSHVFAVKLYAVLTPWTEFEFNAL